MDKLSIDELAKLSNVNIETIHYYERKGLIADQPRNESGHRQYSIDAVRRTEFITRCQSLGFQLKEIRDFLELRTTQQSTCADLKGQVTEKVAAVNKKIDELILIRDALGRMLMQCTDQGPIGECPILEELYT